MDLIQFWGIIATIVGGIFAFHIMTKQEIAVIREQISTMNNNHREDMKAMDEKWERLFHLFLPPLKSLSKESLIDNGEPNAVKN